ncbi:unnamed protein product [Rotaria sp. Silwood1]|nr:unnamed protein product [Rotaria sp. Silwood1]
MIDSSSIISLSDNILIALVAELYERTKQLSTLPYEALLLLRPLPLLFAHIPKDKEWTLLSMTNVAQRKPIDTDIWELTCLILSACSSHTIADAFARFEESDNRLFLIADRK